jgi:hypothetical protein
MATTKITSNVIADDAITSDQLGGDLTMPGHVSLADNKEIRVGTGNDLVIKHDGSHTTLTNTTGNLTLAGDAVYIANAANSEYLAQFIANGAASLRYDNTEQLATVSGGVYVPNKLGIGTNAPAEMLEVYNATSPAIQLNDGGDYQAIMRLAGNDLELRSSSGNMEFYTGNADGDSSTEAMRITSAGNVGIGTSSPSTTYNKQLHINASGTGASLKLTDSGSGTGASDGAEVIMYNTNMYVTNREAANMFLQTSANTQVTIDSGGNVALANGNLAFSTAGKGIDFSAAADISSGETVTSSVLDDYEEGTFTPVITTAGGNYTSGAQSPLGYYTRIGRYVHIALEVSISSSTTISGGSGDFMITGLPYDPILAAVGNCTTGRVDNPPEGTWQAYVGVGNTTVKLRAIGDYVGGDSDGITVAQASIIHGNTTPWFTIYIDYQI